jgi:predicted transposase YdaD
MKTDQLFYELFKLDPRSLFRLVQLNVEGEYAFESVVVKTTEKRFDGLGKRTDGCGPNIFLEIQGYDDPKIYWRLFREVCTYHEQTDTTTPFLAVIVFLDEKYDPGDCRLACLPPDQLIRANLMDCLRTVWDNAGSLTVLKPLAIARKEDMVGEIRQWKADIQALRLPEYKTKTLIDLLEYLIIQRFPELDLKEVTTMLQLTPLEETVAGRQVFQMGLNEGMKKGEKKGEKKWIQKGELIGEIRLAQRLLQRPRSSSAELARMNLKALKMLLRQLETELLRVKL